MSLARHTAYNLAGYLAPMAVSIITVPLYLRIVGIERYGLLTICWTLIGFMAFLNLGMGPAVTQRIAAERRSDGNSRSAIFWTGILLSGGMAIAGALLIWIFGGLYFRTVATADLNLRSEIPASLPWLALAFFVSLISGVANGALQGRQWFAALNLIGVGTSVAVALTPLAAAVLIGPQLPVLLTAVLIVYVCSFAVQMMVCSRAVPLNAPPRASIAMARMLFTYGGWMTMISLLGPLTMLSDRLVIGSRLGSGAVPVYVVPYNLVSRLLALPASLSSASLPKLAGASADQERALLTLGLRMLLAVLMPICAAANMLMAPFLHYWVGDLVAGKGAPVGCILIFGFWMHGIGHIPSTVLQGRGRPDIVAKLLLAYLVPYFAALFAMLHFFGIVGAAIVWSLRASMDLWLFRWARTPRREAVDVGLCSTLVLASSVLALLLDWRGVTFWIVLGSALLVSGALAIWVAPPVLRDWLGKAVRLTPAVEH